VRLDGVHKNDFDILAQWMNNLEDLRLWTSRRKVLPYDDLHRLIVERCRSGLFTIIRDTQDGEPLGFIDGTLHQRDAIAEFEVYVPEEARSTKAVRGVIQFVAHMFTNYPIRKLYCQVYEYNWQTRRLLQGAGFVEEGRFKEFIWWKDRYWDFHIYCLERQTWASAEQAGGPLGRLWKLFERRGDTDVLFGDVESARRF